MSLLKILKEGTSLFEIPSLDNLPPAIREKVFFIASLIDDVTLFLAADRDYPEKISFKSLSGKNNSLGAGINETSDSSDDTSSCHETSCVVCGERFQQGNRDETMDEIAEIIEEIFRPLYPQEGEKFDDTINKMKERQRINIELIQILDSEAPGIGQRILNRTHKDWLQSYNAGESREAFNKSIMLMLKSEYEPGKDINDLLKSLHHLFQYWVSWPVKKIPVGIALGNETLKSLKADITELKGQIAKEKNQTPEVIKATEILETIKLSELPDIEAVEAAEPVLDLSLAKIAYQVGMKIEHFRYYGRRERDRGVAGGLAKQARTAPLISKAFWSLKFPKEVFPKGVSLHKAATMVKEVLNKEKRIDPSPDTKTITIYLKADKKIFELFKPKSVGKKTFLIMEVEERLRIRKI